MYTPKKMNKVKIAEPVFSCLWSGDQWQEAVLLRLAEALEQQLPRRTPPSFVNFLGKD
jgi:hypothetical protein